MSSRSHSPSGTHCHAGECPTQDDPGWASTTSASLSANAGGIVGSPRERHSPYVKSTKRGRQPDGATASPAAGASAQRRNRPRHRLPHASMVGAERPQRIVKFRQRSNDGSSTRCHSSTEPRQPIFARDTFGLLEYFRNHVSQQYPLVECDGQHFFRARFLVIASLPGNEALLSAILAFATYQRQLPGVHRQHRGHESPLHFQASLSRLHANLAARKTTTGVALALLQHGFIAEYVGNWSEVKANYDAAFRVVRALASDGSIAASADYQSTVAWLSRVGMLAALRCISIAPDDAQWLLDYLKAQSSKPANVYSLLYWRVGLLSLAVVIQQHRMLAADRRHVTIVAERLMNGISKLRKHLEYKTNNDGTAETQQTATQETNWIVRTSINIDLAALDLVLSYSSGLVPAEADNLESLAYTVCLRHQDWMLRYRGKTAPGHQVSFAVASLFLPYEDKFVLWRDQVLHMLQRQGYYMLHDFWLRIQQSWTSNAFLVKFGDAGSTVDSAAPKEQYRALRDSESRFPTEPSA